MSSEYVPAVCRKFENVSSFRRVKAIMATFLAERGEACSAIQRTPTNAGAREGSNTWF